MARVPQNTLANKFFGSSVPDTGLSPPRSPSVFGCRSVDCFVKLNKIQEGMYGVVFRARDKETGEIVAIKQLKTEKEVEGFPITSLREIKILLKFKHPNIVDVKEVVIGKDNCVYIVMEYFDHDVKGLIQRMERPFSISELKTLMCQILSATEFLHSNWVIHRDMKTSNLLYNNKGKLKVADFGLAREFSFPLKPYTNTVVTLWYRAPELLLGQQNYTPAIDMWSVERQPLLPGKSELDQIDKIFKLLGSANEEIWPDYSKLPGVKTIKFPNQPYNRLRQRFPRVSEACFDLLNKLLTYDPAKRITAKEALQHPFFAEHPLPKDPSLMPSCPVPHELEIDGRGVKGERELRGERGEGRVLENGRPNKRLKYVV